MRTLVAALISGVLFGVGLVVAGMTRPEKIFDFLDVTGDWDPSLAFVMMGAIGVHLVAYRLLPRFPSPLLGGRFALPTRKDLDARLVVGGAIFGLGWGLAGYCPGPGAMSIASGTVDAVIFVLAMLTGMQLFRAWDRMRTAPSEDREAA